MNAVYGTRFDWALPWPYLIALMLFIAFSLFPAALWAGAITPVLATKDSTKPLDLPSFSNLTGLNDGGANITAQHTAQGVFTYAPASDLWGLILDAATDASDRNGGTGSHAKLDKTGYIYTTRGYGAGASVGLVDDSLDQATSYTYNETGYLTDALCVYNATSEFSLEKSPISFLNDFGDTFYLAGGSLPNGAGPDGLGDLVVNGPQGAVAMFAGSNASDVSSSHYVAFAEANDTGEIYSTLANMQCEIKFEPFDFSVTVNVTNHSISVLPQRPAILSTNLSVFSYQTIQAINDLEPSVWTHAIGDAFINNIANVEALSGPSNASNLQGVSESLLSMLDNIDEAYAAAQLMILHDTNLGTANVKSVAVVFGSPGYIYSILMVDIAVCTIYFVECFRTCRWLHSSRFNFIDIRSVVVGASMGGHAIANKAKSLHSRRASAWKTADDDRLVGQIRVRLSNGYEGEVAVTLDEQEEYLLQHA